MYGCINIIKTKQAHSPGYPVYVPVKRVKLCKILNPFIFLIMFIDHWQFNDLVQIEYKVDNHNRQFQDKCADASQRNNDTLQSYRITQHSKFGVSACCEDSSYCHTVY